MTVGIVGLGLIGGSIGLALRQPGRRLIGFDPDPDSCKMAVDRQCVDEVVDLATVSQADFVFVATPPFSTPRVLEEVSNLRAPQTLFADCTSTKQDVISWAEKKRDPNFLPTHPMAGHEKGGAAFASAWLFRGAKWIVLPTAWTGKPALSGIEKLIRDTGAIPVRMDPSIHDRQVAITSHLPHVIAAALVLQGDEIGSEAVAGSWKDLTRVGGVDPGLWSQIMYANRTQLLRAIDEFQGHMQELISAIETEDMQRLQALLAKAKEAKERQQPAPPKFERTLPNRTRRRP